MRAVITTIKPDGKLVCTTRTGNITAELDPLSKWEMVVGAKGVVEMIHGGNRVITPLWYFKAQRKQFSQTESSEHFMQTGQWPRLFTKKRKLLT